MPTKGVYRNRRSLGLNLRFSNVIRAEDYVPGLLQGVPRGPKREIPFPIAADFSEKKTPIRVEPRVWVIEFDKDLVDLIDAVDKDVTKTEAEKRKFLEDVAEAVWKQRGGIWSAVQKDLKDSFFSQEVSVPIAHGSSGQPGSTPKVSNTAADAAKKKSINPIVSKASSAGWDAVMKEAEKAAKPTADKLLGQLTSYSSLGSYISKNRWVIFGAVIVAGAGAGVYAVVDKTIGVGKALDMFKVPLANKVGSKLANVKGVVVGKAKLKKKGEANVAMGLKELTFEESLNSWKTGAFVRSEFQMLDNLKGKQIFHWIVQPGVDVIADKGEFQLTRSWGKLAGTAGMSMGMRKGNSGLGGTMRFDYELSKGAKIFLEVTGQRDDGTYVRSAAAGWKYTVDSK